MIINRYGIHIDKTLAQTKKDVRKEQNLYTTMTSYYVRLTFTPSWVESADEAASDRYGHLSAARRSRHGRHRVPKQLGQSNVPDMSGQTPTMKLVGNPTSKDVTASIC